MKKIKKFIYLISPNKIIGKLFYKQLEEVFKSNKVAFFQLRLKKEKLIKLVHVGKKVNSICKKYKVKLIINNDPLLVKKIGADGCHLGQSDMSISKAREILKNKIIGITCHNSKILVKKAINKKVDYIAIGAFFPTKTKKVKYRAKIKDLIKIKKITNIPIVAIGGINNLNYNKLLLNKANFLAISGYIWKNKKYKPLQATERLK